MKKDKKGALFKASFYSPIKEILIDESDVEISLFLYNDFKIKKLIGKSKTSDFRNNNLNFSKINIPFCAEDEQIYMNFPYEFKRNEILNYADIICAYIKSINLMLEEKDE